METDVLSEYDIAGSKPVLSCVDIAVISNNGCRGNVISNIVHEGSSFSTDILSSDLEGSRFLQINGAVAEACSPGLWIASIFSILVEVTEYAELINDVQCQTSAPDAGICVIMAVDVFYIVGSDAGCAVQTSNACFSVVGSVGFSCSSENAAGETAVAYVESEFFAADGSNSAFEFIIIFKTSLAKSCLLYTSPSPRD